ncbi:MULTISPECIES: alpha/beta fold hydrolase [unclassified Microbacterium]|uniref:alpha/beta fold hydrolase n=1 Tax=unclassified Microbacterium TaxID=2609290 RepID=UPI0016040287|nr:MULTISPECIES: alpha/beta hydrolase [unclassified Microbacterium]MBT2484986.1 alpha/beta fold hydrolase [Microbacterium sp. ISL-108]
MKLHVTSLGDGPRTVVLIHGLGANADLWSDLAERLVADGTRTVVMPDLRGHGRSRHTPSYRMADFVDDLAESLPAGPFAAVGHSLGGGVLVRAAAKLAVTSAVYLDPGFQLGLPSAGWRGRLFWGLPQVTLPLTMLATRSRGANGTARYSAANREREARAKKQWDSRMAVPVFRELTFDPTTVAAPAVPSTIVLSSEGQAVVPDPLPERLAAAGWGVRRLPSVGHAFWLHDAAATYDTISDLV